MEYKAIKGTKDILPWESYIWQKFEQISKSVFKLYGYREIRTPIIEETELFVKTVGKDTDIVKKEMFSFMDRGERNISLRPEGTAPVIRAYLENNLDKTDQFQKLYYIGPMFRAERPQAGRSRQFYQIGLEAIGASNPMLDAEVIKVSIEILDRCEIKNYRLKLNNLGCQDDKKKLSIKLKELFQEKGTRELLCDDCKNRLQNNPLRVLDCKNENCKAIIRGSVKNVKFLCPECEEYFKDVLKYLDEMDIAYDIDPYIVRGLDYYTRTVFEITQGDLGAQNAIGAGGRYDNLISDLGGPKLGACGFALGLDRMVLAWSRGPVDTLEEKKKTDLFIATTNDKNAYIKAFSLLNELRANEISCDIDYEGKSLKAQMRMADKLGARFVLIIGDKELAEEKATLRDMKKKKEGVKEEVVAFKEIIKTVKEKLKPGNREF